MAAGSRQRKECMSRQQKLLKLGERLIPHPVGEFISDGTYVRVRADGLSFSIGRACEGGPQDKDEISWDDFGDGKLWERFERWKLTCGNPQLMHDFIPVAADEEGDSLAFRRSWVMKQIKATAGVPNRFVWYSFEISSLILILRPYTHREQCEAEFLYGGEPLECVAPLKVAKALKVMASVISEPEIQDMLENAAVLKQARV